MPAHSARAEALASSREILHLQRLAGNGAVAAFVERPPVGRPSVERPSAQRVPAVTVQRHSSFEHKLLGDVNPATLQVITQANEYEGKPWTDKLLAIAGGRNLGKERAEAVHAVKEQLDNLTAWQQSPPGPGQTAWKGVRLVAIKLDEGGADVMCTLGEMNTLADYYGNLEQLKRSKRETLTGILQTVRRQSWVQLHAVLNRLDPKVAAGMKEPKFEGAGPVKGVAAELALEKRTQDGRNKSTESYLSTVARNACHFAPQSWFRWKEYHDKARGIARKAWQAQQKADAKDNDSLRKVAAELANEAIMTNGFGDHYLQDSFAAGHLINKTLVMQWFVEWLGTKRGRFDRWFNSSDGEMWIGRWHRIRRMTTAQQGRLAGTHLYDRPAGGVATDPQSAEEQATREERMNRLGIEGADREQAHQDFLAMINNAAIQYATKLLHDHFCQNGLEVFANGTTIGLVYGDDNMLKGGQGVGYSAETAKISQDAITTLLKGEEPAMSTDQIMQRLPNEVKLPGSKEAPVSLKDWHTGGALKAFCEAAIFPKVPFRALGSVSTTPFGEVSQDWGQPATIGPGDVTAGPGPGSGGPSGGGSGAGPTGAGGAGPVPSGAGGAGPGPSGAEGAPGHGGPF